MCQHYCRISGAALISGSALSGSRASTQSFEPALYPGRQTITVDSDGSSDAAAQQQPLGSLGCVAAATNGHSRDLSRKRQRSLTLEDLARAGLRSRRLPTADSGSCSHLAELVVPTLETEKWHVSHMSDADERVLDTDENYFKRLSVSSITSLKAPYAANTPSFAAVSYLSLFFPGTKLSRWRNVTIECHMLLCLLHCASCIRILLQLTSASHSPPSRHSSLLFLIA